VDGGVVPRYTDVQLQYDEFLFPDYAGNLPQARVQDGKGCPSLPMLFARLATRASVPLACLRFVPYADMVLNLSLTTHSMTHVSVYVPVSSLTPPMPPSHAILVGVLLIKIRRTSLSTTLATRSSHSPTVLDPQGTLKDLCTVVNNQSSLWSPDELRDPASHPLGTGTYGPQTRASPSLRRWT
jgi:hypothetical protein